MKNNIIRFEQVVQGINEADKISIYTEKINMIVRFFAKNTMLQFMFFDILGRCFDLGEPLRTGDISNYLFGKLDELFDDFEAMQNDERITDMQEILQKAITEYNNLNNKDA